MGLLAAFAQAQQNIASTLSAYFQRWGRFVARRPWAVLVASVVMALVFAVGILRMQVETESIHIWSIRERGYKAYEYMSECCQTGESSGMVVYCKRTDGGNILSSAAIVELIKIHQWTVSGLKAAMPDGTTGTFDDVCVKLPLETVCESMKTSSSLLGIWSFDTSLVPQSDAAVLAQVEHMHNNVMTVEQFAGEPVLVPRPGGGETVVSSAAIRLLYGVVKDDDGKYIAFEKAWNGIEGIAQVDGKGVAAVADPAVLTCEHYSIAAIDLEVGRNVTKDIPLFVIAFMLVVAFLSLSLGGTRSVFGSWVHVPDAVRGRFTLAWMAILQVAFAVIAGFGFAALCGAVFNSVVSLIPLILLGVDVDSCIITVNHLSFERTGTIEQRFGRAIRNAGPTCFITTLTTVHVRDGRVVRGRMAGRGLHGVQVSTVEL